jgi:hypothetical protein
LDNRTWNNISVRIAWWLVNRGRSFQVAAAGHLVDGQAMATIKIYGVAVRKAYIFPSQFLVLSTMVRENLKPERLDFPLLCKQPTRSLGRTKQ